MDDQPGPLSLPPDARPARERADRPSVEPPPSSPVAPGTEERGRIGRPAEPPPPRPRLRREGQMVNKGDFLAQIDPRPYQVALAQAEGQLAKDQAVLKNAELDLVRYRTLASQNSIARQQVDTQAALVQQNRGVVQADQAQVDAQKLNLTYCRIVSPVTGRVGLRLVDPGNYVQTSDANGLVVISQLQPISVIFTLPEDKLPAVARRVRQGATLNATAFDRSGTVKLDTGRLETIDNQIDTTTGTVKLRAFFDNADQALYP